MADRGPVTASLPDTLRALGAVLLPLAVRGAVVRRQRAVAVGERVDADRRLVRTLQRLRARYGAGPLALPLPLRRIVLVLADDDVHRVLDASPDPYATSAISARMAASSRGWAHTWADDFTPRRWSETPRAALVPFSAGPAVCAGQNLVLFLTSTFLAALLEGHDLRPATRLPIRPGRPLPGTLDPFHLRFALTAGP